MWPFRAQVTGVFPRVKFPGWRCRNPSPPSIFTIYTWWKWIEDRRGTEPCGSIENKDNLAETTSVTEKHKLHFFFFVIVKLFPELLLLLCNQWSWCSVTHLNILLTVKVQSLFNGSSLVLHDFELGLNEPCWQTGLFLKTTPSVCRWTQTFSLFLHLVCCLCELSIQLPSRFR